MSLSAVIKAPDTSGLVTVPVAETNTDFTRAASVTLILEARDGTTITKPATITASALGSLTATWTNDGSLAPDVYKVWARITWQDRSTITAPTAGALTLTVEAVP